MQRRARRLRRRRQRPRALERLRAAVAQRGGQPAAAASRRPSSNVARAPRLRGQGERRRLFVRLGRDFGGALLAAPGVELGPASVGGARVRIARRRRIAPNCAAYACDRIRIAAISVTSVNELRRLVHRVPSPRAASTYVALRSSFAWLSTCHRTGAGSPERAWRSPKTDELNSMRRSRSSTDSLNASHRRWRRTSAGHRPFQYATHERRAASNAQTTRPATTDARKSQPQSTGVSSLILPRSKRWRPSSASVGSSSTSRPMVDASAARAAASVASACARRVADALAAATDAAAAAKFSAAVPGHDSPGGKGGGDGGGEGGGGGAEAAAAPVSGWTSSAPPLSTDADLTRCDGVCRDDGRGRDGGGELCSGCGVARRAARP